MVDSFPCVVDENKIESGRAFMVRQRFRRRARIIILHLLLLLLFAPSTGEAQTPFFEGKTIRIIVGYPAGTTHDTWARLVGQHMKKYLAGGPDFLVQSMTGAGSMVPNFLVCLTRGGG